MYQRFSNLVLLSRCSLEFLRRGRADAKTEHPATVVIVQFGKLGDMVCTTPMFRAIKKASPGTRVIAVGDQVGGQVLTGNSDVDRYIVCGTDIASALRELKRECPDVGVTVGPSTRAFGLLYLAGVKTLIAPRVVGGVSSESRLYRLMRRLGILVPHAIGLYAPREYLRLLEPTGIHAEDTTKHLSFTKQAQDTVQQLLAREQVSKGSFLVGISPSAGNKLKNWPTDRFARIAEHMSARYEAIMVVIGGSADKKESDEMLAKLAPGVRYIDTTGKLSIDELKALVARLSLFISVDTGPIYIAEAFSVPTIDIVGPMDENEQPPMGDLHMVVVPPFPRRPQLFIMSPGDYDTAEARRQAESITAEQVMQAVDSLVLRMKGRESLQRPGGHV